jgi:hypothetical protein
MEYRSAGIFSQESVPSRVGQGINLVGGCVYPLAVTREFGVSRHTFIDGSRLGHREGVQLPMFSIVDLNRSEITVLTRRALIREN